jgi:hypothetical protein
MPLLSQTEREQVLVEICAAICTMLKLLDGPEDDDGLQFTQTVLHLLARAQAVRDSLQPPQLGRGCADLTLPPLAQPKSEMYEFAVMRPERFVELVRFTPIEFEDLHTEVYDALELTRNLYHQFTDEENSLRRKRRYKYSSRERLFHFLYLCKHYPKVSTASEHTNLTRSAVFIDFVWLRRQLSTHPTLVMECQWGTPEALEDERVMLVRAGLIEPPFENCVAMCDGSKDLARRNAHWNRTNEPDYSQKGNGKSNMLVCRDAVCARRSRTH